MQDTILINCKMMCFYSDPRQKESRRGQTVQNFRVKESNCEKSNNLEVEIFFSFPSKTIYGSSPLDIEFEVPSLIEKEIIYITIYSCNKQYNITNEVEIIRTPIAKVAHPLYFLMSNDLYTVKLKTDNINPLDHLSFTEVVKNFQSLLVNENNSQISSNLPTENLKRKETKKTSILISYTKNLSFSSKHRKIKEMPTPSDSISNIGISQNNKYLNSKLENHMIDKNNQVSQVDSKWIGICTESYERLINQYKKQTKELEELKLELTHKTSKKEDQETIKNLGNQLNTHTNKFKVKENLIEIKELENLIEIKDKKIKELENLIEIKDKKIKELTNLIDLSNDDQEIKQSNHEFEAKTLKDQDTIKNLETRIDILTNKLKKDKDTIEKKNNLIKDKNDSIDKLNTEKNELLEIIKTHENKIKNIENLNYNLKASSSNLDSQIKLALNAPPGSEHFNVSSKDLETNSQSSNVIKSKLDPVSIIGNISERFYCSEDNNKIYCMSPRFTNCREVTKLIKPTMPCRHWNKKKEVKYNKKNDMINPYNCNGSISRYPENQSSLDYTGNEEKKKHEVN